jgi:hypothetical protein
MEIQNFSVIFFSNAINNVNLSNFLNCKCFILNDFNNYFPSRTEVYLRPAPTSLDDMKNMPEQFKTTHSGKEFLVMTQTINKAFFS